MPQAAAPSADSAAAAANGTTTTDSAADASEAGVMYTSTMNFNSELAGHPDYLAMLTVVAAFGWITPKFLHRLVVAFERGMMETEVALAVQ